jgi:hypothetical protein
MKRLRNLYHQASGRCVVYEAHYLCVCVFFCACMRACFKEMQNNKYEIIVYYD